MDGEVQRGGTGKKVRRGNFDRNVRNSNNSSSSNHHHTNSNKAKVNVAQWKNTCLECTGPKGLDLSILLFPNISILDE